MQFRRVLDQIRGRSYEDALKILEFIPYRAREDVLTTLLSVSPALCFESVSRKWVIKPCSDSIVSSFERHVMSLCTGCAAHPPNFSCCHQFQGSNKRLGPKQSARSNSPLPQELESVLLLFPENPTVSVWQFCQQWLVIFVSIHIQLHLPNFKDILIADQWDWVHIKRIICACIDNATTMRTSISA